MSGARESHRERRRQWCARTAPNVSAFVAKSSMFMRVVSAFRHLPSFLFSNFAHLASLAVRSSGLWFGVPVTRGLRPVSWIFPAIYAGCSDVAAGRKGWPWVLDLANC